MFYNPSKLPLNLQELTRHRVQTLLEGFAQKPATGHRKYILQLRQIFFLKVGQIRLAIFTNIFCILHKYTDQLQSEDAAGGFAQKSYKS